MNDFCNMEITQSSKYLNKSTYHYKTIAKKHILWSKKGVYRSAYEEIIDNLHYNIVNDDE